MKTIGLLGGMSWESSQEYYRIINQEVAKRLGGFNSAEILLYSVDFKPIAEGVQEDDFEKIAGVVLPAAKVLEKGGSDLILICTNTVHRIFERVQEAVSVPLIHIADVTAEEIKKKGLKKVGLLGTKHTMGAEFYKKRLDKHGLEVIVPEEKSQKFVHDVIMDELCLGQIKEESAEKYRQIIEDLIAEGAEGIILGCTEIPLLVKQEGISVPLFDTTFLHAKAAVDFALKE
ncbi:aspartate/glutamate racemase family protein [Thermoproteota archaeon]